MTRTIHTNTELQTASKALFYAAEMFQNCAIFLARKQYDNETMQHALLESFLIHTREVLEFFYPTSKTQDDNDTIVAADFFDQGGWRIPAETDMLKNARTRLNKQLAHLSYSRPRLEPNWNVSLIHRDIQALFLEFMKTVASEKIEPHFHELFPLDANGNPLPSAINTTSSGTIT